MPWRLHGHPVSVITVTVAHVIPTHFHLSLCIDSAKQSLSQKNQDCTTRTGEEGLCSQQGWGCGLGGEEAAQGSLLSVSARLWGLGICRWLEVGCGRGPGTGEGAVLIC